MYYSMYHLPLNMGSTCWINSVLYNVNVAEINSIGRYYGTQYRQNYYSNPYLTFGNTINLGLQFNWNTYNPNLYSANSYNIFGDYGRYRTTNYTSYVNPTTSSNNKKSDNQETIQEDLRSEFLITAKKYKGCNESDGSWRKISTSKEWCADFITHVVNETYNNNGYADLKGFNKKPESPHMRVEEIKQWGINNEKYLDISKTNNEAEIIKQNVEKGDIMILRENGASHTGFVTQVYTDGSFDTIEGNRDDKVKTHNYSAKDSRLSGFVQLA